MKRNLKMMLTVWIMAGGMLVATAQSAEQAATTTPAKHWHEVDTDWMKSFHNPMEGLEMGLDLRLREVYNRNIFSLNDNYGGAENWNNYHWQRYRTRWSTKWTLTDDITFNTRLTWEFWGHCAPDNHPNPFLSEKNYDFDEALFDHMNIQFRNAFDLPLTLTVGRQDIFLGTGWLVAEGTPADGSRTGYFDAVRGTYQISDATKLDMIYIQQYDDESKWLKPFNHGDVSDRRHVTQNQDEKGIILYLTNKLSDMTSLDAYYMFKKDERSDWAKFWGRAGVDQETHVLGGRLYGNLDDHWSYSAEGAYQFGKFHAAGGDYEDQRGLGANTKLMYAFNDELKNEVHIGYEYMSGDDPGTGKNEKFNTMWGDWPQYQRGGDLQSYMWTAEGALGEVANLHRLGVGHSFKPHKNWTMASDYNLMWADENTFSDSAQGPGGMLNFSRGGSFRGHMITGLLTYQCCKNFRTQFLVDYFIPGGYYEAPSNDNAMFARINMEWTF
jgi:hypothetical protein